MAAAHVDAAFVETVLGKVVEAIGAKLAQAQEERESLARRIAELEGRRSMSFCGPHEVAKTYAPGSCVQRSGALHVALTVTDETPGSSSHWRRIGTSA